MSMLPNFNLIHKLLVTHILNSMGTRHDALGLFLLQWLLDAPSTHRWNETTHLCSLYCKILSEIDYIGESLKKFFLYVIY